MANTLRFKRGLASGIPTALAGEPLFTTDTFDLYIGNGTTNTRFQKYIASGATTQILRGDGSLYTFPLAISSPSNGQVLKYNGTSWVNDSDSGITGSGSAGQVAYFTGATTQAGNNNLFWDVTNLRLGVGTNAPTQILDIAPATGSPVLRVARNGGTDFRIASSVTATGAIVGTYTASPIAFYINGATAASLYSTGNFGIGTSSDSGQRLQVVGTSYFSDVVAIGATTSATINLRVSKTITGGTSVQGVYQDGTVQTDVTSVAYGFRNVINTVNSLTLGEYIHYYAQQGTIGTSNTITNQYGFYIAALTSATNNYGFFGNIAAATGRWNIYMNGTALNYLNGSLLIGSTSDSGEKLQVTGTMKVTGATAINDNLTVSKTQNSTTSIIVSNPDTTTATYSTQAQFRVDVAGNQIGALKATARNLGGLSRSALYLTTIGSYDLAFGVNSSGTPSMVLDINQNFGIGTTTPSERLTIGGRINFGAFSTDVNDYSFYVTTGGNGGTTISSAGATSIIFRNNAAESARINGSGRLILGGGTTDSGEKLQVTGTAKITGYTAVGGNLGTVNQRVANFRNSGGNGYIEIQGSGTAAAQILSTANGDFYVATGGTAGTYGTTRLLIDNTGAATFYNNLIVDTNTLFVDATNNRVGIGTASPTNSLTISSTTDYLAQFYRSNSADSRINITNTTTGAGIDKGLMLGAIGNVAYFYNYANGDAIFGANNSEHMRLTAAGSLLIGTTTSSGEKLRVNGTILISNGTIFSYSGLDATGALCGTSSSHSFRLVTNNTERLQILSTGEATFTNSLTVNNNFTVDSNTLFVDATANEVGIGTNVPNSVLQVVGSVSKSISDVKTANYTATASDHTILCSAASGAITITLPAASGIAGRIYVIKKINASSGVNSVTVDGNGAETIDGSATINLSCKSSVMLQCDGSNWHILSLYTDTSCL